MKSTTTRRTFFRALLAALPLTVLGMKPAPQVFRLPVGCDLSFTSLDLAVRQARILNFGRGKILAVGPENEWCARELLGVPGQIYKYANEASEALTKEYFRYEVRDDLPRALWRVEFERGAIESQGPS
jgi:hypothetical protein